MEIIDNVYQHCDNNEITMGIYIDLQKAFDTVDHLILLKKLSYYGIRGIVLDWFKSYLTDRKQYTFLSHCSSTLQTVTYGGPTRLCIGTTIIFIIYQ